MEIAADAIGDLPAVVSGIFMRVDLSRASRKSVIAVRLHFRNGAESWVANPGRTAVNGTWYIRTSNNKNGPTKI